MRYAGIYGHAKDVVRHPHRPSSWSRYRPWIQPFSTTSIRSFSGKLTPDEFELRKTPNPNAKSVAVLGGGITGLATAYQLSQSLPDARITLYEAQDRFGGWINSEIIQVDGGRIVVEWGPRNIRPDHRGSGIATLSLLRQLNAFDNVLGITKSHPAASNRFVYFPDHLVRMPGIIPGAGIFSNIYQNAYTILTEPIYSGALSCLFAEPSVRVRPPEVQDESIGDFVRRRFGKTVADNILSAVMHGIYAGDIYNLSARTLVPTLWYLERRDPEGSGIIPELAELAFNKQSILSGRIQTFRVLLDLLGEFGAHDDTTEIDNIARLSIYSFQDGLGHLVKLLEDSLRKAKNVSIRTKSQIKNLKSDPSTNKVSVSFANLSPAENHDYVVSTLSPQLLHDSVPISSGNTDFHTACRKANSASTVMVVNLYYSNEELLPPRQRGFGYLIPRSVDIDQNPERALGVIFASECSSFWGEYTETDPLIRGERRRYRVGQDTARGTKLTVMLGGHWWDGWSDADLPGEAQAIHMARRVLERHLNIREEPKLAAAKLARNAIPQYRVGYRQTMNTIHKGLMREFRGRIKVAGPFWQGGVGINDCVMKAREAAITVREAWDDTTGLEDYSNQEKWILVNHRTGVAVVDKPEEFSRR